MWCFFGGIFRCYQIKKKTFIKLHTDTVEHLEGKWRDISLRSWWRPNTERKERVGVTFIRRMKTQQHIYFDVAPEQLNNCKGLKKKCDSLFKKTY